jgi:hypothetical protein
LIKGNIIVVFNVWKMIGWYGICTKNSSKIKNDIEGMVPKFLNVFHVRLKRFLGIPFLRCDCLFYER